MSADHILEFGVFPVCPDCDIPMSAGTAIDLRTSTSGQSFTCLECDQSYDNDIKPFVRKTPIKLFDLLSNMFVRKVKNALLEFKTKQGTGLVVVCMDPEKAAEARAALATIGVAEI